MIFATILAIKTHLPCFDKHVGHKGNDVECTVKAVFLKPYVTKTMQMGCDPNVSCQDYVDGL